MISCNGPCCGAKRFHNKKTRNLGLAISRLRLRFLVMVPAMGGREGVGPWSGNDKSQISSVLVMKTSCPTAGTITRNHSRKYV